MTFKNKVDRWKNELYTQTYTLFKITFYHTNGKLGISTSEFYFGETQRAGIGIDYDSFRVWIGSIFAYWRTLKLLSEKEKSCQLQD